MVFEVRRFTVGGKLFLRESGRMKSSIMRFKYKGNTYFLTVPSARF